MSNWQKPSLGLGLQGGDRYIYEICMKLFIAAICDNTRCGNNSTEKEAEASLVNALAMRKAKEVIGTLPSFPTLFFIRYSRGAKLRRSEGNTVSLSNLQ
jgi:hypothetical protein